MQAWSAKVLCEGAGFRPRQFEFNPHVSSASPDDSATLVFGTIHGEVVVARLPSDGDAQGGGGRRDDTPPEAGAGGVGPRRHPDIVASFLDKPRLSKDKHDSILGLSWLRKQPGRFLVGSSAGVLHLCEVGGAAGAGTGAVEAADAGLSARRVVRKYEEFPKLTSIHGNCEDQFVLVSGYSHDVRLYDLETGAVVRTYENIHQDHINISRFANHSPDLFATSSFDRKMKLWDLRCKGTAAAPIYTVESALGNVMVCWSPESDTFLLASAVDNAVTQYLAVDGRHVLSLDIPKTGLEDNFTRAYYSCSGRVILSGSSEERVVRLHCAQTGEALTETELYPGRKHESLYVQSLRGDPLREHRFAILVNYRDAAYPLEIIAVDMKKQLAGGGDGEPISTTGKQLQEAVAMVEQEHEEDGDLASFLPTARLIKDLAAWHDETTRELSVAAAAPHLLLPAAPASPSACLAPLSLEEGGAADDEEDDEAVLLLVTAVGEGSAAAGSEGLMEVDGASQASAAGTAAAPALFRVAAPVVCARCEAIRERVLAAAAAVAEPGSPSGAHRWRGQALQQQGRPLLVALPFAYYPRPVSASSSSEPWLVGAPQPAPPAEAFLLLLRYLFCDDLHFEERETNAVARLPLLESLHLMAQELGLPRLASLVESYVGSKLLAAERCLEVLELAERLGAVRLTQAAAYYAAIHQEVVLPLYASRSLPHGPQRLAWLRAQIEDCVRELDMLLPVAPGSLRPCNADGSYDDDGDSLGGDEEEVELDDDEDSDSDEDEDSDEEEDGEGEGAEEAAKAPAPSASASAGEGGQQDQEEGAEAEAAPVTPPRLGTCLNRITGHTATFVRLQGQGQGQWSDLMVVLGGGNMRNFHSMRNPLIYNVRERRWSKVHALGQAPPSCVHHTTMPLDDRHLLVFGGLGHARPSDAEEEDTPLHMLDLLTLRWHRLGAQPPAGGACAGAASVPTVVDSSPLRSTAVLDAGAVRVEPRMRHTAVVRRNAQPPVGVLSAAERATLPPRMTETFIFGGYSPQRRVGLNDCLLLTAEYDEGVVAAADPGPPSRLFWSRPDVQGEPPAPRLGHGAVLLDFPEDVGGPRMLVVGGIGAQMIFGDVHSCRAADPQTFYAGGSGAAASFLLENSVGEGRSGKRRRRQVVWEEVELTGDAAPEARYGHTLTKIDNHTVALFGGVSQRGPEPTAFSDLWLLHVEPPSADRDRPLRVSFSAVPVVGGAGTPGYMLPPPSASANPYWFARPDAGSQGSVDPAWYPSVRARHSAVFAPAREGDEGDGVLLVFGGSDEGSKARWQQLQDEQEEGEGVPHPPRRRRRLAREADTHVFELSFQRGEGALALLRRARIAAAEARAAARAAAASGGSGGSGRSTPQPTPAQERATDVFVYWLLLHAQGAVESDSEQAMASLLQAEDVGGGGGGGGGAAGEGDEVANWGVVCDRVRVVAARRSPEVRIVAGSSEPPITIRPSTLVRDLKSLLRFDGGGGGEQGAAAAWPRLFQSVRLVLEEGGYTVWAHRSWLARRCPYFGRALASGMREAADRTIALADVSPSVLRALLVYIYTDTLQTAPDAEEEGGEEEEGEAESLLFPLLVLAHRLGLESLVALAEGYVREALCDENCVDVLQYADELNLVNLKLIALAKISRCFDRLGLVDGGEAGAVAEAPLPPHLLAEARAFHSRIEALHAGAAAASAAAAGGASSEEEAA